jgi:hypothetical protein
MKKEIDILLMTTIFKMNSFMEPMGISILAGILNKKGLLSICLNQQYMVKIIWNV